MDPITHLLLGATTAQLGFRQRIGRDAPWIAAAAAAAPDLDIFFEPLLRQMGASLGEFSVVASHRGPTHSLLVAPLLALPLALGWWWLRRALRKREAPQVEHKTTALPPPSLLWLYVCVLAGIVSHPLLDWCTSYGTMLLWPLTDRRLAIDALPIVDVLFTSLLAMTLLSCWLIRRIRRKPSLTATRIVGWTGFVLALAYIAAGYTLGQRAQAALPSIAADASTVQTRAYPQIGTIFLWRVTRQSPGLWEAGRWNALHPAPIVPNSQPTPDNEWIRRAAELPRAERFRWFADGQVRPSYWHPDGLHVVEFDDMRYSFEPGGMEGMWSLTVTFDEAGLCLRSGRSEHMGKRDRWMMIRGIWDQLQH